MTKSTDVREPVSARRRTLLGTAIAAPFLMSRGAMAAEKWPSHTVSLVSPYNPGGTNDLVARLLAERLQATLGQAFIVENKPGAAGVVGARYVMRAKPDGYTLLSGNNGVLVIQAAGRVPPPYDPLTETTPIMKVADAAQFIGISAELPATNLVEFIELLKKDPGKYNYSSSGMGSYGHFVGEYFKLLTGTDILHIPGKGSGSALIELTANRVQMMIDPMVISQGDPNRIRVLATLGDSRFEAYPDVPTIVEAGGPAVDLQGWFGLVGPAGMPQEIVDQIMAVGREVVADPKVRQIFLNAGLVPSFLGGAEFRELIGNDLRKVAEIRERAQIVLQS